MGFNWPSLGKTSNSTPQAIVRKAPRVAAPKPKVATMPTPTPSGYSSPESRAAGARASEASKRSKNIGKGVGY